MSQLCAGQAICGESDVSQLYTGVLWGARSESVVCRPTVGTPDAGQLYVGLCRE